MLKPTLLSLAVASAVFLAGCGDNGDSKNAGALAEIQGPYTDQFEGRSYPRFNPALSQLPVPSDIQLDQVNKDGSFTDAPPGSTNPVLVALGKMSGASLIAPIDIAFSGPINADSVSATDIVLAGGSPAPNPQQNVFLLEVAYASGDPIQGLPAQEVPTLALGGILAAAGAGDTNAGLALAGEAQSPLIRTSVLDLQGTTVLRIQPARPLKPKTRYLVVVLDTIQDDQGRPITQDPAYFNISNADLDLPSAALAGVRSLVNGFWEPTAGAYLSGATNGTRTATGLPPVGTDNIALSYSFTTTGDEKVTEYVANPTEWFNDSITNFVRFTAATQKGSGDYSARKAAADVAVAQFDPTTLNDVFADLCGGATGPTGIACASQILATQPPAAGGIFGLVEQIADQPVTPNPPGLTQSLSLLSAPIASLLKIYEGSDPGITARTPVVSQGSLSLPYFLGIPQGADGSTIQTSTFVADDAVGDQLNRTFASVGLALPQGATEERAAKSDVVNYIFPFPKRTADVEVPYVAIYPGDATGCPAELPVVIFQHGITTDRSAALSVGGILADNCFATLAIDLPLHGIAPFSTEDQQGLAQALLNAANLSSAAIPNDASAVAAAVGGLLTFNFTQGALTQAGQPSTDADVNAEILSSRSGTVSAVPGLTQGIQALTSIENTVANAGSTIPGLAPFTIDGERFERHFDFTANASLQPVPMNFDSANALGSSGSLYINLTGFVNGRDKNRQAVLDLLNLRASVKNFDVDGDGDVATGVVLDRTNVFYMGHSLGTVPGTVVTAVANSVPVSVAPGAALKWPIKGSALLAPAVGLARMLENSPGFAPTVVGGLAAAGVSQGSANFETFLRVLQAALDPVDPISFADNLNKTTPDYAKEAEAPSGLYNTNANFQTSATGVSVLNVELTGRLDDNGNAQSGTEFLSDQTNPIETEVTQLTTQFGTAFPDLLSGNSKLVEFMGATNVLTNTDINNNMVTRLDRGSHAMFVLPQTPEQVLGFTAGIGQSVALFKELSVNTGSPFSLAQIVGSDAANPAGPVLVSEKDFADKEGRNGRQLNNVQ